MNLLRKTSAFTMVEMMIALTIFGVMSVATLSVYIQTTNIGQKMRLTRHLSETAREITERISDDVKTKGISLKFSGYDDHSPNNESWKSPDYTQSGGEILTIGTEDHVEKTYFFGKKVSSNVERCTETDKMNPKVVCGLYELAATIDLKGTPNPDDDILSPDVTSGFNLADSFIPEESKKRVKIEDLKFYISGDGISTEKKVTLVMTLGLMPRMGVSEALASTTKMHIQTTISERFYK